VWSKEEKRQTEGKSRGPITGNRIKIVPASGAPSKRCRAWALDQNCYGGQRGSKVKSNKAGGHQADESHLFRRNTNRRGQKGVERQRGPNRRRGNERLSAEENHSGEGEKTRIKNFT